MIREIQERIPPDLLKRLMKKELMAPATKKIVEVALTKPDSEVTPRQKRRLQALLDSGQLSREVEVLDHEVEKQIDDFFSKEIAIAVKLGRLPAEAPQLELLKNKGQQYARRKEAQLRREFLGETDDAADDPQDDQENKGERPTRTNDGGLLLEPGR